MSSLNSSHLLLLLLLRQSRCRRFLHRLLLVDSGTDWDTDSDVDLDNSDNESDTDSDIYIPCLGTIQPLICLAIFSLGIGCSLVIFL